MPPKGDLARQRLLEAVKRDPGIGPAVAARLLGMDPSTASYHVRVLARRGRLIAQRAGGTLALFENGHGACPWMRGALPALRQPNAQVAAALLLQGPVTPGRLRRELGLSRSSAGRLVRALVRAGIAVRRRDGLASMAPGRAPCVERAVRRQRCSASPACPLAPKPERRLVLGPPARARRMGSTPGVLEASRSYARPPCATGLGESRWDNAARRRDVQGAGGTGATAFGMAAPGNGIREELRPCAEPAFPERLKGDSIE